MKKFSRNQKISIASILIAVLLAVVGWFFKSGQKFSEQSIQNSPGAIQVQGNGNTVNPNPFPTPSFSYSVSFLNNNKDFGIPPTPTGQYKSAFSINIIHAPATDITGTIEWRTDLFSSCILGNSNWAQWVNNYGMLVSVNQFVCFSKQLIQDDGKLFKYSP